MQFTKIAIFINSLIPLSLLLWDLYFKKVGPNPLEFVTRTTGMLTLVFLLLTLSITPLRKIFGVNDLVKARRMIGLFAFFYGALHLLTYVWFDQFFNLRSIVSDVTQRRFILVGMTAFLLMVPLAITSTNKMVKRLGGKTWARLHRVVYVAAILGVLHFWMLVKSDVRLPLTFGFILALLLAHRLAVRYFPSQPTRMSDTL
ncbi:MAG TPA: protein-methionine-sulfoxide reductase heme-binding subunit MsrQ [Pyrinomonadaceae bacterium]|nr:protein-methionine-sulfoxide reductase heme-binding subunit MsrQ [Pyrinomonadaceae bacterium]